MVGYRHLLPRLCDSRCLTSNSLKIVVSYWIHGTGRGDSGIWVAPSFIPYRYSSKLNPLSRYLLREVVFYHLTSVYVQFYSIIHTCSFGNSQYDVHRGAQVQSCRWGRRPYLAYAYWRGRLARCLHAVVLETYSTQ